MGEIRVNIKSNKFNSIIWPINNSDKVKLYLGFIIQVLEGINFTFSDVAKPDPIVVAKRYLSGDIPKETPAAVISEWWSRLKDGKGPNGPNTLEVRWEAKLAFFLLFIPKDDEADIYERIPWFFMMLGIMKLDKKKAEEIMNDYFEFKEEN